MNTTKTLRELVEQAVVRHSTSVRQLSFLAQGANYRVVSTTLNQIRNGTYKSVPTDDTIRAIAYLAGVDESVAFTAAGQPVPGPPLADELPPGADNLSPKSRKVVLDMVRVLVDLEAGNHDTQDKPETNPSGERTLRAVGSGREVVAGQKMDLDDPDYLRPLPLEQMAAHPNFKLHRDKFDEAYGDAGEENQDPDGV